MPQICVVSIYVSDMELAKDFYCGKLGFEIDAVYDEDIVSLQHDSVALILCKTEGNSPADYPHHAQVVIGIQTDNIVNTMSAYRQQGIQFIYDTPMPCPPGLYTSFKDPFGNVIELLEFAE